jgi:hypothetical protein
MNRTPPLLKALGLQPHFVRLARLTQQELPKANISVAYLLRGFVEGEWKSQSSRHAHYTIDARKYWPAHMRAMNALRAQRVDAFFVTYPSQAGHCRMTAKRWQCDSMIDWARSHSKEVYTLSPAFASQFGTAAAGLQGLPIYDAYVITRIDIEYAESFASLLRRLPLALRSVTATHQESGSFVNDVWWSFPHSLRRAVQTFLNTTAWCVWCPDGMWPSRQDAYKPGVPFPGCPALLPPSGCTWGRTAHLIHHFDPEKLPVHVLWPERFLVSETNPLYVLAGGPSLSQDHKRE